MGPSFHPYTVTSAEAKLWPSRLYVDSPGVSDSKKPTCHAGDLGLIPGSGRSTGEVNSYPLQYCFLENSVDRGAWWAWRWLRHKHFHLGFPWGSDGKVSACNVGNLRLIPGSGRSPGEENGNPLQYSCLENPVDRAAWQAAVHGVTRNQTQLSD